MTETTSSPQAIDLASDTDRRLVQFMFHERRGLANTLQYGMEVDNLFHKNGKIQFMSDDATAARIKNAFAELSATFGRKNNIDKNEVKAVIEKYNPQPQKSMTADFRAANQNKPGRHQGHHGSAPFAPRTEAQAELAKLIDENTLVFAVGPAGTGKTHVAMQKAVAALKEGKIKKILLARPAQEAGEKLGYLPGDQKAKMDPYMRPLYDELDKIYGPGGYNQMISNGVIEVAPIGFMRGRTFSDAFVIVDEAQNSNKEQTKMFLTRLGENCKMVVTGDPGQIDLQNKRDSGLMWAANRLKGKPGVGVREFEGTDVMRSEIVKTVVAALDAPGDEAAPAPAFAAEAAPAGNPRHEKGQKKQWRKHESW